MNILLLLLSVSTIITAQISPGDLSKFHEELEGISNCTKCHDLGKQVSKAKCLNCHTEITDLINQNRGYHSSKDVIIKDCWACHGEHFGRNFQIIRFEEKKFDHSITSFELKSKHKTLECSKCHNSDLIIDSRVITRKNTFLGLSLSCNKCHEDIHQETLGNNCADCHSEEKFKPALKFSHDNTKFKLKGKHTKVECINCHKNEIRNGKKFQKFANVKFSSCNSCHKDKHEGKFGNKCQTCHNTNSFKDINANKGFNHSRTDFPLIGKHRSVKCEDCHHGSLTEKLKFNKCYDCHKDYHNGQFIKGNSQPDCKECHSEKGFTPSLFTIEDHKLTNFNLTNAHAATPCISCHLKNTKWVFKIRSEKCIDCHENIHENEISAEFFKKDYCESCHSSKAWDEINFDHSKTKFELLGKHQNVSCRQCHFVYNEEKIVEQKFSKLNSNCSQCHKDVHSGQFTENQRDLCIECHTSNNWEPTLFAHNSTRFKLEGAHKNVNCTQCHKVFSNSGLQYINYKIEDVTCKSCHS